MDPDGANRIVMQRINEWYAERQEARDANLLNPASRGLSWPVIGPIRRVLAAVASRARSLRHRQPDRRTAMGFRATEPSSSLAEEPLS
jgi:hypothetical protein